MTPEVSDDLQPKRCRDPECECDPGCDCEHIHCLSDHVWSTLRDGLIRLTPHQLNRLTMPPAPYITPCNGCTAKFGDGTVVYHLSTALPGHPLMLEQAAHELLDEELH